MAHQKLQMMLQLMLKMMLQLMLQLTMHGPGSAELDLALSDPGMRNDAVTRAANRLPVDRVDHQCAGRARPIGLERQLDLNVN